MTGPAFFGEVRRAFGSLTQKQVDGINAILTVWAKLGDGDKAKLAYLLATTRHETADTYQPIYERGPKSYFAKYHPGTKLGKALGNTEPGDGYRFRGAGYVQLTGRANFKRAGIRLGYDLLNSPELATDPDVAARVLIIGCLEGWFTGKKLADYIGPGKRDFTNARRVINGTDKAALIAGYANTFLKALEA